MPRLYGRQDARRYDCAGKLLVKEHGVHALGLQRPESVWGFRAIQRLRTFFPFAHWCAIPIAIEN